MSTFFNTDEFAEAATYTPAGGSGSAVTVVLSRESATRERDDVGKKNRREAEVLVQISEVASPAHGDTITINSEDWRVIDVIHRDDYTALLSVERVETIERTSPGYRRAQ